MKVEKIICDECGKEASEKCRVDISWYSMDLCTECKKMFDVITKEFNEKIDEIQKEEKKAMQKGLPFIYPKSSNSFKSTLSFIFSISSHP